MYSPLTTMPRRINPVLRKALTVKRAVNMPVHALETSKTRAFVKLKCCFSRTDVLGSNETWKFGPSQREIFAQMSRSISSGPYLEFSRQFATAFFAKSIANSVSPAIRRETIPVNCSSGKFTGLCQFSKNSLVELLFGGR